MKTVTSTKVEYKVTYITVLYPTVQKGLNVHAVHLHGSNSNSNSLYQVTK